jgi:hypothetical protein
MPFFVFFSLNTNHMMDACTCIFVAGGVSTKCKQLTFKKKLLGNFELNMLKMAQKEPFCSKHKCVLVYTVHHCGWMVPHRSI